jgi:8-oxo-dGTP pyrophosphatase MutT (NUDIX family)
MKKLLKKIPPIKKLINKIVNGSYQFFDNKHGSKFWGNKGAGILPYCIETKRFLVGLRSKYVNEPLQWGIFGGKIDDNELPELAAIREMKEELNFNGEIKLELIYLFQNKEKTFDFSNYIGYINKEFVPELDWETKNTRWVTYDELILLSPIHFGLQKLIDEGLLKI